MKYISARERSVLSDILNPNQTHTLKSLSIKNDVSTRTIRRDLATLGMLLRDYGLLLDTSEEGIVLHGDIERAKELLAEIPMFDYSSVERTLLCYAELVDQDDFIKLVQLQQALEASSSLVTKAIDELGTIVNVHGGKIERRRNAGIQLIADEESIRYISFELALRVLNQLNVILLFEGKALPDIVHPYLHHSLTIILQMDQLHHVISHLSTKFKERSIPRDDQIILEAAVYACVVMKRLSIHRHLSVSEELLVHELIDGLAMEKEGLIDISIFLDSRMSKELLLDHQYATKDVFERFLSDLLARSDIPNHYIRWFYDDLYQWFLKNNQASTTSVFSDELLVEVLRQEYPILYRKIQEVIEDHIPMYRNSSVIAEGFVLFISKLEDVLQHLELRALVVCIGGMGSSRMIITRLRNQFPKIHFENVSLSDLTAYHDKDYDFIVSTVQTSTNKERTVRVSPLLFESDISKIKQMLKEVGLSQPHKIVNTGKEPHNVLFMSGELNASNLDELFLLSGTRFLQSKIITDELSYIQLMKDKGEYGYGIPDTNVAIYHVRSDVVALHTVDIIHTRTMLAVPSMTNETMEAKIHLFMVSGPVMSEAQKSVFNTISVLLTQSAPFISLLTEPDISMIQKYIEDNMIGENI